MTAGSIYEAIAAAGMDPPQHIEPGRIVRFPGAGKARSNRAGWVRLFEDGRGAVFGDYTTGLREVWQAEREPSEPRAIRKPAPPPKPTPSDYAVNAWHTAGSGVGFHPYAKAKGITWDAGARRGRISGRVVGSNADCVLVPIRDVTSGRVFAVQAINPQGAKQTFGPLKGHGLLIGNTLDKRIPWYVAEGWATAVSMVFHHHHGNACCGVAFGKSNLDTLADAIEAAHA
ncbi:MAG: hypothetical protein H6948_00660, partial [Zoogloeaceae bacterium]|nr:hypothetical protein [Zoogloeaceae bacterium]